MRSMSLKDDLKCRKEDTSFYLKSLSPLSSIALMSDSLYLCLPPISIGTTSLLSTRPSATRAWISPLTCRHRTSSPDRYVSTRSSCSPRTSAVRSAVVTVHRAWWHKVRRVTTTRSISVCVIPSSTNNWR